MSNRFGDWLKQAVRDLDQAEESRGSARHEWACFAAHQAAEKAVKALHLRLGQEAWGHVLSRLLTELPDTADTPSDLVERGRVLDGYYVPTRYPNGHPDGPPFEQLRPAPQRPGTGPCRPDPCVRPSSPGLTARRSRPRCVRPWWTTWG
jgi:HEPN domain-containing protein